MPSRRTFLAALLLALACGALGCNTRQTKNFGAGECLQYTPTCIWGVAVCDVDKRGCRVCTCAERGAPGRMQNDRSYSPEPIDPDSRSGRP
ncbi:MAG: hypothetical protein R3F39_13885 [Myxococcota bacterium]